MTNINKSVDDLINETLGESTSKETYIPNKEKDHTKLYERILKKRYQRRYDNASVYRIMMR